jgi:hypothetical protein
VIVENLGARPARAGLAHLPEIVRPAPWLVADAHDAIFRDAYLFVPDIERFIVGVIDGHHQALRIDP